MKPVQLEDLEADLIARALARLNEKAALVIAPKSFAVIDDLLGAGCQVVHVVEPSVWRAGRFRRRFRALESVHVYQLTRSELDERGPLELAESELRLAASVTGGDESPIRVGLLMVTGPATTRDALAGLDSIGCELVIGEFEASEGRGSVAALSAFAETMRSQGFSNFVAFTAREDFLQAVINDAESQQAEQGTVVFVRDDRWSDLAPLMYQSAARVQLAAVERGLDYREQVKRQREALEEREALLIDTIKQLRMAHTLHRLISLLPRSIRRFGRKVVISSSAQPALMPKRRLLGPRLDLLQHECQRLKLPASYHGTSVPPDPPTISIVTPSLNHDRFIESTMTSVLDQGYPRLQYVVQDGGSTDTTVKLLERFGDRLYHWESAPDAGQAAAINAGFRHATGEIMAYLNSDDFLLPGSLAYVAQFFNTHPDVDVVYSHRVIVDENGLEIGRWILPRHDNETLMWADYVPQETLFWRRSAWQAVGGSIDESLTFALDWDLLLRFQRAGARFARVPRFLAAFRVHGDSKTFASMDVGIREMDRVRERWHERPIPYEEVRASLRGFYARHLIYRGLYAAKILRY